MDRQVFQCSFCHGGFAYQVILPAIRVFFRAASLPDSGLLEVAISEAMTNAIRASDGQAVFFSLHFSPSQVLKIRIRDHGKGFDIEQELNRIEVWNSTDSIDPYDAESGRGMWIIQQVFDKVQYNDRGNEVLLVKNI